MRLILNLTNMSNLQHFCKTGAASRFLIGIAILSLLLPPCFAGADPNVKPQEIPDFLTQKGKSLSALKAVMNITSIYDAGKSRQDVKGFLLYRRPNDFRFQGLAAGGNSLFELIIKSNNFELYVPTEGKIIQGGKDCFSRKFPDVAEIESLIPLILLQWKDVRFDRVLAKDAEKTVIRVSFQGKVWGATFDPQTLYLKRLVRLSPKGDVELTADFSDFKTGEDAWLPRRFDLQSPAGAWRTSVHINKLERNPFLIEKNFKLEMTFSAKTEACQ
ncbi:MAG: LolA family protein [Desulfomonilaceae bacterium]